jgi:outer membrane protein
MKKLLLIGVGALCFVSAMAQDTTVLTFQEAVKIALMNNVTLRQQRNQLEVSQTEKNSAIASLGPNISLNGSATRFSGNSFNQQQGRVINGVRDNVSGSINGTINIFSGFGRLNSIRQYARMFDAQQHLVDRTAQDVINTVSTQYLQVLLDMELIKIARENFQVQQNQLAQVKEYVSVGAKSPVDQYNQDALTKNAELRLVQAEIALTNDKALLTQTLLIDPFDEYDVRDPNWSVNEISADSLVLDDMLTTAKLHRGDYLRAVENESAQRYGSMAAKSYMMPSLIGFANYGSGYNFQHDVPDSVTYSQVDYSLRNTAPGTYELDRIVTSTTISNPDIPRPFNDQFRRDNVYKSFGLQLNIPLFNGLQNRTAYVRQRVVRDNATLLKKSAEFQLKNDVLKTARNYEGVKKAYLVSVDQLKAAELAFQYEKERYNLGVTNLVEYSTANRAYVQALTDKAQAEYRLLFQKIQLEYALGTLKIEDLE